MSETNEYQETIREQTQYAREDALYRELRAYLKNKGFDPQQLLFAELVSGEEHLLYAAFVTPEGNVYELEQDLDTYRVLRFKAYANAREAVTAVPLVEDALEMVKAQTPA